MEEAARTGGGALSGRTSQVRLADCDRAAGVHRSEGAQVAKGDRAGASRPEVRRLPVSPDRACWTISHAERVTVHVCRVSNWPGVKDPAAAEIEELLDLACEPSIVSLTPPSLRHQQYSLVPSLSSATTPGPRASTMPTLFVWSCWRLISRRGSAQVLCIAARNRHAHRPPYPAGDLPGARPTIIIFISKRS